MFVKARRELPMRPVDQHHRSAFGDADDSAKPAVNANQIIRSEPEGMVNVPEQGFEKLALGAIAVAIAAHAPLPSGNGK
jgi:hypothetical protein